MVKIYKQKFSVMQQEILRFLMMKSGMSFNARALAKSLNRTQAGVIKALAGLEKQDLVKAEKDKDSGRWSIEFNADFQKAINFKRVENLRAIYESGLVEFLEDKFPEATIILFGSYSRGEDVFNEKQNYVSDIDIAIIGSKNKKLELKKFNKILEREIIINFYYSFKDIHKNLKENILNGILLKGGIEL